MPTLTNDMKREIILEHYSTPDNKQTPDDKTKYKAIRMDSDSCIDDITIYLDIENDVIKDAMFDGVACAISTSSTDILCDMVKGKNAKEALNIIEQYENMLHEKPYDQELLEELNAFSETYKQAARIKCASLGAQGISKIIKGEEDE